jgi:hypothetical protein
MSKVRPCVEDASDGGGKVGCGEIWTMGEFMPGVRVASRAEELGVG